MKIIRSAAIFILFLFFLSGCGSGGGSGDGSSVSDATGTLSVSLSDATTDDYQAVYITVQEVSVHRAEDEQSEGEAENGEAEDGNEDQGWITVATPNQTYNLLDLVNGALEQLGVVDLEAGHYTQMRLLLGETPDSGLNLLGSAHPYANYVIDSSDASQEMDVPSGYQSGIKIVQGFDIVEDQTRSLILDFDASKSIVRAGNSGKLILKPTIKVVDEDETARVSGSVSEGGVGVGGVYVSVQTYDSQAAEAGRVVVQSGTVTEDDGSYVLRLDAGTYYIVAYKDGYQPVCAAVVSEAGGSYVQNFELTAAGATGSISGAVSIAGGGDDASVTLSFRQTAVCSGDSNDVQIEIKSVNVAAGGDYNETLPEGTYTVVASMEGAGSQVQEVTTGSIVDWAF